jgi:hypothetical protein
MAWSGIPQRRGAENAEKAQGKQNVVGEDAVPRPIGQVGAEGTESAERHTGGSSSRATISGYSNAENAEKAREKTKTLLGRMWGYAPSNR